MSIEKDKKIIEDLGSALTVKLPYSSDLNYPLDKAIELARKNLPRTSEFIKRLNSVKTAVELETLLKETNNTLIVEKNFAEDFQKFLNIEKVISKNVENDMDEFCPLPTPTFTKEEVDQIIKSGVCEIPNEPKPSDLDISALTVEPDDVLKQQKDLEECLGEVDKITDRIQYLISEEKKANEIKFLLDEASWFFRIMPEYYKERNRIVKKYLGIYEPLLLEKRRLKAELEVAPKLLYSFKKIAGNSGIIYTKIDDNTPTNKDQDVVDNSVKHPIRVQLEKDLEAQEELIKVEKEKTSQFDSTIDEITLRTKLGGIFGGNIGQNIKNKISGFATEERIIVHDNTSSGGSGFSVNFTLVIDSPIFQGYRNGSITLDESLFGTRIVSGGFRNNIIDMFNPERLSFDKRNPDRQVHGVLYDRLYNIMGNPNLFFSDVERGCNTSAPPSITDEAAFENFWTNFADRWEAKKQFIIDTLIKPYHLSILGEFRSLAEAEAIWLLAYGRVFEDLIDEDDADRLRDIVSKVENEYEIFSRKEIANKNAIDTINLYRSKIKENLELEKAKYSNLPCAKNPGSPPINVPAPGNDPLGKQTYKGNNPQLPDPTKFCYWLEFAKLATIINILPMPNNNPVPPNLFRYWPVGLIIPSSVGPFNIPLPIVWLPLAAIPTPFGIFVIFLGQCGILPCPFVLWISPDGESQFIATLRGKKKITDITGRASNKLPPLKLTLGSLKLNGDLINMNKDGKSLGDVITGYKPMSNPDSSAVAIKAVFDRIIKKINKLENPDFSLIAKMREREVKIEHAIKNKLSIPADFSLNEKINAIEESVKGLFDKIQFDDICFPKDKEKLNPKQTLVGKTMETLAHYKDLQLPGFDLPSLETINLKEKLFDQFSSDTTLDTKVNLDGLPKEEKDRKIQELKDKIKVLNTKVAENLKKPEVLGIVAAVPAGLKVNFFNPFVCSPSGDGAILPPVNPLILAGIIVIATTLPAAIDLLTEGDINGKSPKEILMGVADRVLPPLIFPDPRNLSMKTFAVTGAAKLALFSKPKLPNPGPIVINICIPGALIKLALEAAIVSAITSGLIGKILLGQNIKGQSPFGNNPGGSASSSLSSPLSGLNVSPLTAEDIKNLIEEACKDHPTNILSSNTSGGSSSNTSSGGSSSNSSSNGIGSSSPGSNSSNSPKISFPPGFSASGLLKMRDLNPSDIRQLLTTLMEGALQNVEKVLKPILISIEILKAFPELNFFKLPMFELNKGLTLTFEKKQLEIGFDALEKLSVVPFLAVAAGAEASRLLHPLANVDDLPPWERLSLKNILFVVFLDQFCQAAKSGGGFQENTLFPGPG